MRACAAQLLLLVAAYCAPPLAGSWLQAGGGASRASLSALLGPAAGGAVGWSTPVGTPGVTLGGVAAAAFAEAARTTLYVGSRDGTLASVAAASGALRCAVPAGGGVGARGDFSRGTPAVSEDVVVASTASTAALLSVVALNATTGAQLWALPSAEGRSITASPLMLPGGDVAVLDNSGFISLLDSASGDVRWETLLSSTGGLTLVPALALAPRAPLALLILVADECTLSALDAGSGAFVWNATLSCELPSQQVLGAFSVSPRGDMVLVGTRPSLSGGNMVAPALFAFATASGEQLWRSPINFSSNFRNNPPAFSPDGARAYLTNKLSAPSRDFLFAIDAVTGDEVWRVAAPTTAGLPSVGADDIVYFATGDLPVTLSGVFGANGSAAWSFVLDASSTIFSIVIADTGQLAFPSDDGTLHLIGAAAASFAPSASPTPTCSPGAAPAASRSRTATAGVSASPSPSPSPAGSPAAAPALPPPPPPPPIAAIAGSAAGVVAAAAAGIACLSVARRRHAMARRAESAESAEPLADDAVGAHNPLGVGAPSYFNGGSGGSGGDAGDGAMDPSAPSALDAFRRAPPRAAAPRVTMPRATATAAATDDGTAGKLLLTASAAATDDGTEGKLLLM